MLYDWTLNYGVAILLFAVVVKLVLLPFQMKSKRSMMRMAPADYEGAGEKA